jgi:hypothetical protein
VGLLYYYMRLVWVIGPFEGLKERRQYLLNIRIMQQKDLDSRRRMKCETQNCKIAKCILFVTHLLLCAFQVGAFKFRLPPGCVMPYSLFLALFLPFVFHPLSRCVELVSACLRLYGHVPGINGPAAVA